MFDQSISVTLGTFKTTGRIRRFVEEVLDSERLSYGPMSRQFEERFAQLHGCKWGVASNSGTSSLLVALLAMKEFMGWKDGDEVIVPALTFVATVNAVLQAGLKPVLVDVSPLDFNISPAEVEKKIKMRTRCILPVHLFGLPADMQQLRQIAIDYQLGMIEDSCEAVCAKIDKKPVGSWSDIGCFSTYTAHHLVTGVGGMATTNNIDLMKLMRSLVNHGLDLDELPNGEAYDPSFLARKFRFTRIGHSFRVTELESAIGLAQLDDLPINVAKRRDNAEYLLRRMHKIGGVFLQTVPFHVEHSWMVFPILLTAERSKWGAMQHLQQHGIECREMVPLTNQPCYRFNPKDYRIADWINQSGFYVGCHQDLTTAQLDYVADVLEDYLHGAQ